MFSSFSTTSVASVDRPLAMAQTSPDLPPVTEESKDSQFSSSFSIRSILSSSSTSPPPTRFFSPFSRPQLLLAADSGPADYFPLFPHHCCSEGACVVNWHTDAHDKKPAKRKERGKQGKRSRTIFTPVQLEQLESTFSRQQYVAGEERRQLAASLKLTETHVKVWFQNRRIRLRKQANQQTCIVEKAPSNELDV